MRPLGRVGRRHPQRYRPQRVDLAAVVVLVGVESERQVVRIRGPAGAEHDPRRAVRAVGAQCAGRERAVRLGPHALAVERDSARRGGLLGRPLMRTIAKWATSTTNVRSLAVASPARTSTSHAARPSRPTRSPRTCSPSGAAGRVRGRPSGGGRELVATPDPVQRRPLGGRAARAVRGADQVAGLQLHAVVTARHP